jgi:hypothetical protein
MRYLMGVMDMMPRQWLLFALWRSATKAACPVGQRKADLTVPINFSSRNPNSSLGTLSLALYTLLYAPSINHRSLRSAGLSRLGNDSAHRSTGSLMKTSFSSPVSIVSNSIWKSVDLPSLRSANRCKPRVTGRFGEGLRTEERLL